MTILDRAVLTKKRIIEYSNVCGISGSSLEIAQINEAINLDNDFQFKRDSILKNSWGILNSSYFFALGFNRTINQFRC